MGEKENKVPIVSAQELLEIENGIKTMWAMLPQFIDEYEIYARLKWEKLCALKKEGFTEEQAMQIVIALGPGNLL